jgi:uncharacterized protein
MLLDLSKLRTARERVERTWQPSASDSAEDFAIVALVVFEADVFKDKLAYRLAGRASTSLELTCSRCAEPFRVPVEAAFDLRYLPHRENTGEGEREVEEDDLTTAYYREDTIDLGELVREQLYLALPMKPLCEEACKGLCPQCGTNLNRGACDCRQDWHDPRLEALKAFTTNRTHPKD